MGRCSPPGRCLRRYPVLGTGPAEPGRSIVAAAAVTCYTVGTIKAIPGTRTYVSVDGGMSDNPRPLLYGSGYEAFLPRATDAARPFPARVVGKHCESGDVVIRDARLPGDLAIGDILATPVTGAYGHSMASNYNKVGRPPVVFVRDGDGAGRRPPGDLRGPAQPRRVSHDGGAGRRLTRSTVYSADLSAMVGAGQQSAGTPRYAE